MSCSGISARCLHGIGNGDGLSNAMRIKSPHRSQRRNPFSSHVAFLNLFLGGRRVVGGDSGVAVLSRVFTRSGLRVLLHVAAAAAACSFPRFCLSTSFAPFLRQLRTRLGRLGDGTSVFEVSIHSPQSEQCSGSLCLLSNNNNLFGSVAQ